MDALFDAVCADELELVRQLLKSPLLDQQVCRGDKTLVQAAARAQAHQTLRWLLDARPHAFREALNRHTRHAGSVVHPVLVNLAHRHPAIRMPMLLHAAEHGAVDVVRGLLRAMMLRPGTVGADTALSAAAKHGHLEVVRELLSHVRCVNFGSFREGPVFPLRQAVEGNHTALAELLVQKGALVFGHSVLRYDRCGHWERLSLVSVAVRYNNPQMIRILLAGKAHIDDGGQAQGVGPQGGQRVTPLCEAVSRGKWAAARELIRQGASLNLTALTSDVVPEAIREAHNALVNAITARVQTYDPLLWFQPARRRSVEAQVETALQSALRLFETTVFSLAAAESSPLSGSPARAAASPHRSHRPGRLPGPPPRPPGLPAI